MIIHYKNGTKVFNKMDNIITPITVSCVVERKINDYFTVTLEILKDTLLKFKKINVGDIIKVSTPEGRQLFRLRSFNDKNKSTITFAGTHLFFDLEHRFIWDTYIKNKNGQEALNQILANLDKPTDFTAYSNITTPYNLRLVRLKGCSAILGNSNDNSLVKRYGGEIDYNNLEIRLLDRLGEDKGYKIRDGKNLTDFEYEEDDKELCTCLIPVLFDGVTLPEKFVYSPLVDEYPDIYINAVKLSDIKLKDKNQDGTVNEESEGFSTEEEMFIEARKRCKEIFEKQLIDRVRVSTTVEFIDIAKTEQYKDLQFLHDIKIGDTVEFILDEYNVNAKERVIAYTYDSLTEDYISLEIGKEHNSIFKGIDDIVSDVEATKDEINTKLEKVKINIDNEIGQIEIEIDDKVKGLQTQITINAEEIKQKVSNGEFESYKVQTAQLISQKVSAGEVSTIIEHSADQVLIAFNDGSNYIKHTKDAIVTKHDDGSETYMGKEGFKYKAAGMSKHYQYITFNARIAKIRNGYWTTVQFPSLFKGKRINEDFQLFVTCGDIDADAHVVGSRRGALRNIFAQWSDWNSANATLKVRPCLQKIGIDTGSLFGWDNATTSIENGAVPNEGAIDIIVFAQM